MNDFLSDLIVCPKCHSAFNKSSNNMLVCAKCNASFPLQDDIPIFSQIPASIVPSEKVDRSADKGTRWRQANWHFLEMQIKRLTPDQIILDVGAGRGDFFQIYKNLKHISLDIYPYPEVEIVCDLSETVPFLDNRFDCVLLMNVCEHIYEPRKILSSIHKILKPGGKVIISVPFYLKIHQAPFDFHRFTHYALQRMGTEAGFRIEMIEGFYDAAGLIQETIRYYKFWEIPKFHKIKRALVRPIIFDLTFFVSLLERIGGKGKTENPNHYDFPAPLGYHLVLSKPAQRTSR